MKDFEKIKHHIVSWLDDYCQNASKDGFVVGVSGGIDSAVTSLLCAETGRKVILVNMPIRQSSAEVDRAREHVEQLVNTYSNVSTRHIDLNLVFEEFSSCFGEEDLSEQAMANSRSRMRMVTLYQIATPNNLLVCGTGNKIEDFGVGFYTKYGDGGVDLSPIADLVKSEVFNLGRMLGVIDSILQAKPTDGLFDDTRGDEDQLGASYDELEWAMENVLASPERCTDRQCEVLEIYKGHNQRNQHKMLPVPVCKISTERLKN